MRNIRKHLVTAALTAGIGFAGVLGASATAVAAEPTTPAVESTTQAVPAQGWYWINRWQIVFSQYGGPSSIGWTADEMIYLYCQHNGIWGWQTYAWVPSLNQAGWIKNGDITGYTDPIAGLEVC